MTTLYRKYRPSLFEEISGQQHIIRTLTNAIKNSNISHAYLFTGPRGTGKTTTARIFAKTVNCLKPITKTSKKCVAIEPCNECTNCKMILENKAIDLIEIDAASHTGVDNIRQLKEAIDIPPTNFQYKVYIIDEVHMLSMGAFNALLKTLEEPPAHAIFILATTELHKVPTTIISRCQQFNIKPLTREEIVDRLDQIAKKEKIKIDKEVLSIIAIEASGGMRDAESLLGQLISLGEKTITLENVQQTLGISPKNILFKLITNIAHNEISSVINTVNSLHNNGVNVKSFNKQLLRYCRHLMILKIAENEKDKLLKNLMPDELAEMEKIADDFHLPNLIMLIALLQNSLNNFNQADIPQLPLEMALIEYSLKVNPQKESLKKKSFDQISPSPNNGPQKTSTQQQEKKVANRDSSIGANTSSPSAKVTSVRPKENITTESTPDEKLSNSSLIDTPSLSINSFLDKWAEIIDNVKEKSLSISGVLKNCAPSAIEGNCVIIKVPHTFGQKRLNDPKSKLTIEKIFANIFKVQLKAKFLTEEELPDNIQNTIEPKNTKGNTSNETSSNKDNDILYEAMKKIGGKIIKE